ncbi:hypothetical protein RchiOBHm_Chr1g0382141 [Rosa chinensis]|uniref:Uncharacterized protein n=1 Tax=Rosa chinensis TaxID=74649 RepID=A0A2P6SPB8_ROSCH|nr:hypothetical protein RchiOBHm_Chr3g0464561 [Rosa chinensis]PRQ43276.1 hypothetical protein RchiOBHm_Chr3g0466731 [Rosa chinensis]PRQ50538.1 hypothetical protein RchiOBHm_Chr2g0134341 [Rosa chinensis]PRQ60516.1 hypothetical protein RchiOBHm_Chr1g0382141 [Rosa chinensis]
MPWLCPWYAAAYPYFGNSTSVPSTWICDLIPVNLVVPCYGNSTSVPSMWICDLLPVNLKIH